MPAIELENVYKGFGETLVLRGFDLQVEAGEIYGLLGPNGAGKSTLMHLLLGFLRPQQGRVRVLGTTNLSHNQGNIGYLPERLRYHLRFSARQYLRVLGKLDGIPKAELNRRIETELETVGLSGAANRPMNTFSRGMLQRVGIAQALLNDPKLLLLDEPTSGLDPGGQAGMLALLAELRQRGMTVLLASHYIEEIEQVCDRVGILFNGRIATEKAVETLRTASSDVLIRAANLPEATVERLNRLSSAVQIHGHEIVIAPNSSELQARVLHVLLDANVTVLALQPRQKPLAELFNRVTRGEDVGAAFAPPGAANTQTEPLSNGMFAPPGHPDAVTQPLPNELLLRELRRSEEQDRA